MTRAIRPFRALWRAPVFSPLGFLWRALVITIAYVLCHACGLRAYTSVLSGTSADRGATMLGLVYVFFHFAFVIGVPILLLGAAGLRLLLALRQKLKS